MTTTTNHAGPPTGSPRITKKLSPQSRGALKLARRFGPALVCVRDRSDDKGEYRFTTVEILVDKTPIQPRTDRTVGLTIGPDEKALQAIVRTAGGTWDYKAKVWRIPRRVAGILKLMDRISEK
jgi:hypothetical protein